MDYDEQIEFRASMKDELSRPATVAAEAVDHLGDELRETAAEAKLYGAAVDDAGDKTDKLAAKLATNERQMAASARATKQARDELGKFTKQTSAFERSFPRLFSMMKRFNVMSKLIKGVKWSAIATGVAFLATALKGLGVAAFAATAGLSPMVGVLGVMPGLLGTLVQTMVVFKMATGGMGKAIQTLSNSAATAQEIEEATKGMTVHQIAFAEAVAATSEEWKGVKRVVSDRFFRGMVKPYQQMSKNYLPIVTKYLGKTADHLGDVVESTMEWMSTRRGMSTMTDIFETNTLSIKELGVGTRDLFITTLNVMRAANPTMLQMSRDFRGQMADWRKQSREGEDGMSSFFSRSWNLMKRTGDVLGSYMTGLMNVGRSASGLSSWIGQSLDDLGQRFEDWTGDKKNQKKMEQWFDDMIPVIEELGYWTRDITKALGDISMSNEDFVKTSKTLREVGLPVVVDIFSKLSGWIVPLVESSAEVYNNLEEGGVTGGIGRVLRGVGNAVVWLSEQVADMPDGAKILMGWATTFLAANGLLKKATGVSLLKGFTKKGVQKVWVVNMRGGGMGGDDGIIYDKDGKPKPKHRKQGKLSRALGKGKGAAKYLGPMALFGALQTPAGAFVAGNAAAAGVGAYAKNKAAGTVSKSYKSQVQSHGATGGFGMGDAILGDTSQYEKVDKKLKELQDRAKNVVIGPIAPDIMEDKKALQNVIDRMENIRTVAESMPESVKTKILTPGAKLSNKEIMDLIDNLDGVPKERKTSLQMLGVDISITKVQNLYNKLIGIKSKKVYVDVETRMDQQSKRFGVNGAYFVGGETTGAGRYLVGEMGPEAFVSKSGAIRMVGVNGPEIITPGAGAVVTASATQDPFSGAAGNTPAWALETLRAASNAATASIGTGTVVREATNVTNEYTINVPVTAANTELDITSAVRRAIAQAERERKERS